MLLELNEESLRKFTIKYIYNDNTSKSLGEMRMKKWKGMKKKKNFAGLGIDEDSHINRSKRVQFVVNCMESFNTDSDDENPLLNGYQLNSELRCVPLKYTKDPLPQDILSFLSSSNVDDSVSEVTENEIYEEDGESDDDHDDCDYYGNDDVDELFDF